MPRLTSFDSNEPIPPTSGDEWTIRAAEGGHMLALPKFVAVRGDASIPIGRFEPSAFRTILRTVKSQPRIGAYEHFEISMPLNGGQFTFTLKAVGFGIYVTNPDSCSVTQVGLRVRISIDGVGTAEFRNSWKDSDTGNNIQGFVSVETSNNIDEESLVWLAATLGRHGLPSLLGD